MTAAATVLKSPAGPVSKPLAGPGAANPRYLLELIVADLHWSALQVGSLVIMAGACAAPGSQVSLHTSRHLVYDDTRVMRLALRYAENAGLPPALREGLDKLYIDIGELQTKLAPFAAPATLSASQREQLGRLMVSFRKIMACAAERLGEVETFGRTALRGEYGADSATLRQFLGRAARGDLSDVNRYGVLTPPRLSQRRQSPRLGVSHPCRLLSPLGEFSAVIVDVSRSGLGLSCDAGLAVGAAVTVVIGARRLDGTVQRREGRQIGLSLKRALPIDDPLFRVG